jgi:hypothetical protein
MKAIPLTKGFATVVDDEDYDRLIKYRWFACMNHTGHPYACRGNRKQRRLVWMHRVILGIDGDKKAQPDHINHDTLDNRRSNLRICTKSQNQSNRRRRKDNSTGVHGTTFDKESGKFRARIKVNGKSIHLGRFETKEQAFVAYREAALRLHGEFASPEIG